MKATKISDKRLLLEFPTQKELTLHFFRISEFFESDSENIKGKRFSFDEFVDHYSDKKGNLDYFSYWEGFNIPVKILVEFAKTFFEDLSEREIKILKAVSESKINQTDGYVVACKEGDKITLLDHYSDKKGKKLPYYARKKKKIKK
jgi:hypothetical protein